MSIVDELHRCLEQQAGISNENVLVPRELINRVLVRIKFLESRAGAVTEGPSHADLKRRQGPQEVIVDAE